MLKIENLMKLFHGNTRPALNNINLTIDKGEYCILLGSNGSGKSTLIKSISGEYRCNVGSIFLNNQRIDNQPLHNRAKFISSVAQDIAQGTIQEMSLLENLTLSHLRGQNAGFGFYKKYAELIANQIKTLNIGLEHYLHHKMSALSGGQRQSIATLMALNPIPKLLLLDEHTSALDPKTKKQILSYTDKHIIEHNITTIMITHNIDDALKYGNRLIIMNMGSIIFDVKGAEKKELTAQKILKILHENEGYHD